MERLAKILADIHVNNYSPFYDIEGYDDPDLNFWFELPEKSNDNKVQLDKNFFRRMAKHVYKELNKTTNKQEVFARMLWNIHATRLVPFYKTQEEYDTYMNDPEDSFRKDSWNNLTNKTIKKDKVDKQFFRRMAKHIIAEVWK